MKKKRNTKAKIRDQIVKINQGLTLSANQAYSLDMEEQIRKERNASENATMVDVSVIMPVFNCVKYLDATLDCLCSQTLKNIEIICINDGSTDSSLNVLHRYAARDSRIIVIDQANQGQSKARNRGLEIARGSFIGFMDADDYVPSDYFEKLLNAAQGSGADIVQCRVIFTYPNGTRENYVMNDELLKLDTRRFVNKLFFTYTSGFLWNKIYRRSILSGMAFHEGIYWEDNPFVMEAVLNAETIITIPDVFYEYLQRPNSTVTCIKPKIHFDLLASTDLMLAFLKSSPKVTDQMYREFAPSIVARLDRELERAQANTNLTTADLHCFKKMRLRTIFRVEHISLARKLEIEDDCRLFRKHFHGFMRPFRILEIPFRLIFNLIR